LSFAERVIDAVYPLRQGSADLDTFVHAICDNLFQEIEDLASDGDNGETGWSVVVDLNRIPDKGLDYIAQFVGVQLPPGITAADKRARIARTDGWLRGSKGAIQGAPLPYLTGAKTVILRERDVAAAPNDPPYGLTVITRTSETPNSAQVLAALLAQKPAGILLNYVVLAGQDYQILFNGGATTYQNVFTTYLTYQGVLNAAPGT
jgi:hypothetical protein